VNNEKKAPVLTLEHLAPYLPYGVEVKTKDGIFKVVGWVDDIGVCLDTILYGANAIPEYKLILRPLSDLTKEIEHKGERFVPKELLREISGAFKPTDDIKNTFTICIVDETVTRFSALCVHINQLELFQKLFEWHFDVFGLIEKGLAIDINSIEGKEVGNG